MGIATDVGYLGGTHETTDVDGRRLLGGQVSFCARLKESGQGRWGPGLGSLDSKVTEMTLPLHQRDARYQHSRVYQLRHPDRQELYVGSTTMSLKDRLRMHRGAARSEVARVSGRLYPLMNATGVELWTIELLRDVACWTRAELEAVEMEEALRIPELMRLNVADRVGWGPEQTPEVVAKRVAKVVATCALRPGRAHTVGAYFATAADDRVYARRLGSCRSLKVWRIGRRTRQQAIDLAKEYIEGLAAAEADVPPPPQA